VRRARPPRSRRPGYRGARCSGPGLPPAQRASHLPLDSWLRGTLRETGRELLLGARSRGRGYFRPDSITRLVEEHESGRRNHQHEIWTLMMLELWHREYVDAAVTEAAVA